MFNVPGFIYQLPNVALIHEDPSQEVQGGLPGEHYHLSAALYDRLIQLINNPVYSEVVSSKTGALMISKTGDVMHQLMFSLRPISPPSSTGTTVVPTPIGDVVTPPVPTSAPLPSPTVDPFWKYVVLQFNGDIPYTAFPLADIPTEDAYHSLLKVGIPPFTLSYVRSSLTRTLFGKAIIEQTDTFSTNNMPYLIGYPKQGIGLPANFSGDWTLEAWLGQQHVARTINTTWIQYPDIIVGDYNGGVVLDPFGSWDYANARPRARFMVSQPTIPYPYPNGQYYGEIDYPDFSLATFNTDEWHCYTIEKWGQKISIYIDGVWLYTIVFPNKILGNQIRLRGELFGPVRVTNGVSRYAGAVTIPTSFFPKG